ncbi:MAG: YidC/Oxa1 family membrane protein insertase [Oscillospiraceae bacterium]|nr:YidC/Oxa1 family membrane protein insertase [Oscillospiraceae bacterium]
MGAIFDIIAIPLGWLLKLIYDVVTNYGLALMLFTLITKVILFPLSWKQKKSSIRMAAIQPMINDINKKYANDMQKRQEELTRVQQENGISATAGCLPMLIQLPILFGLINVIYEPLTHLAKLSEETIAAATEIATNLGVAFSRYSPESSILTAVRSNPEAFGSVLSADQIAYIQDINMSFLGLDLTLIPSIKQPSLLWIIPILSVVTMAASQIIMMKLNGQKMEGPMRWMPIYTTLMFGYFAFAMPAGVTVYWIFSSVFGILQDFVLRIFFDPEKEKAKIEEEMKERRKAAKNRQNKKAAPGADGKMTASQAELGKKRLEKAREASWAEDELTQEQQDRLARARAKEKETYGAK